MRLSTYLVGVPVAVAAAVLAVANRETIAVSLDPFSPDNPALSAHLPVFLLLFLVFVAGILFGWAAALWTRKPAKTGRSLLPFSGRKTKPPKA